MYLAAHSFYSDCPRVREPALVLTKLAVISTLTLFRIRRQIGDGMVDSRVRHEAVGTSLFNA